MAQRQTRPLRFRGAVKDPLPDIPRGFNVRAALAALGDTLTDLRDRALLSVAYDSGLRASELVTIAVADIGEAIGPDARLLRLARTKRDQEGEVAGIESVPVFRRTLLPAFGSATSAGAPIIAGPTARNRIRNGQRRHLKRKHNVEAKGLSAERKSDSCHARQV